MAENKIPTTPAEYRKGRTKVYTCSSGFVVEMRKMPIPTFAILFETMGLDVPAGTPLENLSEYLKEKADDPKFKAQIVETMIKVIPHIVVKPVIVEGPATDAALSIDDIDPGDGIEIFMENLEFSGINKMAEDLRNKFREQLTRKDSGEDGTSTRNPTV